MNPLVHVHAKFQDLRTSGSGGEDIKVFTIYGNGGDLCHVRRLHIKIDFDWPSGFRREDVKNCGRTTTTDAGLLVSYKLIYEPLAQVS